VRGGFGPALLTSRNERGHLEPLRQGYDDKDDDQDAANDQCDPRHIKKVEFSPVGPISHVIAPAKRRSLQPGAYTGLTPSTLLSPRGTSLFVILA
jgi:hypothetical protein